MEKFKSFLIFLTICLVVIFLALYFKEHIKALPKALSFGKAVDSRPLSGAFEVPAGRGRYRTGIPIKKGNQLWFQPLQGRAVVWDGNLKRKIIIPERGTLRPCTKTGELVLLKQATSTKVAYKIYP